ncbi:MAG: glycoside hydrolase family 127 protein [Kiritimatiellae bacterium]|nr:glycoside hydrolase family 127 protein [Kiritimatiellia bacterium]
MQANSIAAPVLAALTALSAAACAADAAKVRDLGGYVGGRMRACYEGAVKGEDEKALVAVFKIRDAEWDWKSEFWGKWMHSAPVFASYYGDDDFKRRIAAAAAELIATQTPDGYIGNYPPKNRCRRSNWDVWGCKYTMLGLIHQYDFTGDRRALGAALKMMDDLASRFGPGKVQIDDTGNFRGMPSLSVLEPVMWLYNRTREERCLAFAKYIVGRMEEGPGLLGKRNVDVAARFPPPPKWWVWENGAKAYEMTSCYQGLVEYARATGDADKAAAAVAASENIFRNEINICGSGASEECWCYGRRHQQTPAVNAQECCVTTTWMRFCEALWRETRDPKWADRFERAFYNAFLGSLLPGGERFAMYGPLAGTRHPCGNQCGMKINCCTANGPRGFVEFLNFMAHAADGALTLNLYAPAKIDFELENRRGTLAVDTAWPESGEVAFTLESPEPVRFKLRLRLPGEGRYREIDREWKPGEKTVEKLPLEIAVVKENDSVAFTRGPVTFARDARFADGDIFEPVGFKAAKPAVRTVGKPAWGRQAIEVTVTTGSIMSNPADAEKRRVKLVDYASAGNTWNGDSRYAVWLRHVYDPESGVNPGGTYENYGN